ncbi:MAG: hypothetical protein RRB13_00140 [bacterium]|nr:hypothetical protein [bacterium]
MSLILALALLVLALKYIPPVNDWARGNLPEAVLSLIGERPKNFLERGADGLGKGLEKATDKVKGLLE